MFKVPEEYRITDHPILRSNAAYGNNGAFEIPLEKNIKAYAIASDGLGWEHVSVHVVEDNMPEIPTWEEMCKIKALFWDEEDCVIQYHPPKSQYINHNEYTLHLWRPIDKEIPMPDSMLVGIKKKV